MSTLSLVNHCILLMRQGAPAGSYTDDLSFRDVSEVLCRGIGFWDPSWLSHMLTYLRSIADDERIRQMLEQNLLVTEHKYLLEPGPIATYTQNMKYLSDVYPSILDVCFLRTCEQAQVVFAKMLVDLGADIYCNQCECLWRLGHGVHAAQSMRQYYERFERRARLKGIREIGHFLATASVERNGPRYVMDNDRLHAIIANTSASDIIQNPSRRFRVISYRLVEEESRLRILESVMPRQKSARS